MNVAEARGPVADFCLCGKKCLCSVEGGDKLD